MNPPAVPAKTEKAEIVPPDVIECNAQPLREGVKLVLVVDDSRTIRRMTATALLQTQYNVRLAATGGAGLELARSLRPDLIILDFRMPDMNGEAFIRQLAVMYAPDGLPVLAFSAHGTAVADLHQRYRCVVGALSKPVEGFNIRAGVEAAFHAAEQLIESGEWSIPLNPSAPPPEPVPVPLPPRPVQPLPPVSLPLPDPTLAAAPATPNVVAPVAPPAEESPVAAPTVAEVPVQPAPVLETPSLLPPSTLPPVEPPERDYRVSATAAEPDPELLPPTTARVPRTTLLTLPQAVVEETFDVFEAGAGARDASDLTVRQRTYAAVARHFLDPDALSRLVVSITDAVDTELRADRSNVLFEGPRGVMDFPSMLNHLRDSSATGRLECLLPDETVSAFFLGGAMVGVTSGEPDTYCAHCPDYPFDDVPRPILALACQNQRLTGVPVFVTAFEQGFRPEAPDGHHGDEWAMVTHAMRWCADRALRRVSAAPPASRISFVRLTPEDLPAFTVVHPL